MKDANGQHKKIKNNILGESEGDSRVRASGGVKWYWFAAPKLWFFLQKVGKQKQMLRRIESKAWMWWTAIDCEGEGRVRVRREWGRGEGKSASICDLPWLKHPCKILPKITDCNQSINASTCGVTQVHVRHEHDTWRWGESEGEGRTRTREGGKHSSRFMASTSHA